MEMINTQNRSGKAPSAVEFFESIYASAFLKVARYIHKSGGQLEDAKDTFHDALVIYYEKCIRGNVEVEKSEEAYILGIAKHLWLRKTGNQLLDFNTDTTDFIEIPPEQPISEHKLLKFLEGAGEKCLRLLHTFYYGKLSMETVANKLGYSTPHSAAVQKYKCIEKIRKEIKQKSMTYEDFFE